MSSEPACDANHTCQNSSLNRFLRSGSSNRLELELGGTAYWFRVRKVSGGMCDKSAVQRFKQKIQGQNIHIYLGTYEVGPGPD